MGEIKMKRTWDTTRLQEHQKLLDEKYDGDIHDKNYQREVYCSNMRNYRARHKEKTQEYNREYQKKYREERKYYYGRLMYNKTHPDHPMTEEQYAEFRKQKEQKRLEKLARKKHDRD